MPALALGVNAYRGHVTNAGVAEAHGLQHTDLGSLVDGADLTVARRPWQTPWRIRSSGTSTT